jgi:hypothetical protein
LGRLQTKPIEIKFTPANPIQGQFILCTKRESMFDGGVGNGKTTGGLMKLLILAIEFPGSRWVIARQTYKDLMNTTRVTFGKICPPQWIKREVKENMTLTNGSEILWLHLDELDEGTLRGLEINGAFISQSEEISPDMWEMLDSRIGRWRMPEWPTPCPRYIWGDCNPNGHDWIYFRFHPDVVGDNHPRRGYFFGNSFINEKLMNEINPGYMDDLRAHPESWKRRWVYGSREIFEGQIHPEFKKEIHVYDSSNFDPYDRCNVKSCWGWFDYGLSAPTCLLISASTSDNFHFITCEYYRASTAQKTITIREHAQELQRLQRVNRMPVRGIYADPSIFKEDTRDRRTATTSIAKEYRECGVYMARADNNEAASIDSLRELMHIDPTLRNPITGRLGSPRLFISSKCVNLIEQVQLQRHAETRNPLTGEKEFLEERAQGIPDHAYDPLRYFANSSVWQPPRLREQPPVPSYRTGQQVAQAVGGYAIPGSQPRTKPHPWRKLSRVSQPNRLPQR